jgi:hypothetical protein
MIIILGQLGKSLIVLIFCESFSTIDEHNIGSIREIINRINILQIYLINWWAQYSTNQSLRLTNIILGQLGKSLIVSIFCESIAPIDEHNILRIYRSNWWAQYSANQSLQLMSTIFYESIAPIDEHNIGSICEIINRINILRIYLHNWWE